MYGYQFGTYVTSNRKLKPNYLEVLEKFGYSIEEKSPLKAKKPLYKESFYSIEENHDSIICKKIEKTENSYTERNLYLSDLREFNTILCEITEQ